MMPTTGTTRTKGKKRRGTLSLLASALLTVGMLPAMANASDAPSYPDTDDPRFTLQTNEELSNGVELLRNLPKVGPLTATNSDMAFTGDYAIQGNYSGFNVIDVSDAANPQIRTQVVCPGGQGDVNVYGDLMFTSVEQNNGRVDCGTQGNPGGAQEDRFRGIRIWDISDLDNPVQLGGIQTCRGSHTNRLVEDPNDPDHVYLYNSGTSGQRDAAEKVHTPEGFVDGRCGRGLDDPNPSSHMIEIIKVPLL
jgi:hypothetical protein